MNYDFDTLSNNKLPGQSTANLQDNFARLWSATTMEN